VKRTAILRQIATWENGHGRMRNCFERDRASLRARARARVAGVIVVLIVVVVVVVVSVVVWDV